MPEERELSPSESIARLRESGADDNCLFAPDIAEALQQKAISTFARKAANEDVLLLVLSNSSGKAGFLFTDKALYFREVSGFSGKRLPYSNIINLSLDRKHLIIEAGREIVGPDPENDWVAGDKVEWDLSETLLNEKSRSKIASTVVLLLQEILGGQGNASPAHASSTATTETTKTTGQTAPAAQLRDIKIEIADPVDWPRVLAFHLPIAVLGIPLVMPFIIGGLSQLGPPDNPFDLNYSEMVIISLTGLGACIYAFGTDLKFSFGRYLIAIAALAFVVLQAVAKGNIGSAIPVSFGGGVLGLAVAYGLGYGGLAVYNIMRPPKA